MAFPIAIFSHIMTPFVSVEWRWNPALTAITLNDHLIIVSKILPKIVERIE
jgi:hypothetical protein